MATTRLPRRDRELARSHAVVRLRTYQRIANHLGSRARTSVVDFCSGRGHGLAPILRSLGPDARVLAVDIDERSLAIAVEELRDLADGRLTTVACDVTTTDFAPRRFDAVICAFSLHLLDDPAGLVRRWQRLLTPGGRMYLALWAVPHPAGLFDVVRQELDRAVPALAGRTTVDDRSAWEGLGRLARDLALTVSEPEYITAPAAYDDLNEFVEAVVQCNELEPVRGQLSSTDLERLRGAIGGWASRSTRPDPYTLHARAQLIVLERIGAARAAS